MISGSRDMMRRRAHGISRIVHRQRRRWRRGRHNTAIQVVLVRVRRRGSPRKRTVEEARSRRVQMVRPRQTEVDGVRPTTRSEIQTDDPENVAVRVRRRRRGRTRSELVAPGSAEVDALALRDLVQMVVVVASVLHLSAKAVVVASGGHVQALELAVAQDQRLESAPLSAELRVQAVVLVCGGQVELQGLLLDGEREVLGHGVSFVARQVVGGDLGKVFFAMNFRTGRRWIELDWEVFNPFQCRFMFQISRRKTGF